MTDLETLAQARRDAQAAERAASAALKAAVIAAYEIDPNESDIARRAGVDRMTVRKWIGKPKKKGTTMATSNVARLTQEVADTMPDHVDDFDVPAIVEAIGEKYGFDAKVDDIPSDEYWALVEKHDTTTSERPAPTTATE